MNSDKPAFPTQPGDIKHQGLTKREYFAAMTLAALAAHWGHGHHVHACEIAVSYADELLKQLEV